MTVYNLKMISPAEEERQRIYSKQYAQQGMVFLTNCHNEDLALKRRELKDAGVTFNVGNKAFYTDPRTNSAARLMGDSTILITRKGRDKINKKTREKYKEKKNSSKSVDPPRFEESGFLESALY